jgi:hypothetical protein
MSQSTVHDDGFVKKKNASSWVHKHFHIHHDPTKHLAKCDVCKETVSWGSEKHGNSTSSLTRHLEKKHRDLYDTVKRSQAVDKVAAADANSEKSRQQHSMSSFFKGTNKEQQERALLKFVIDCGLPKGPVFVTVPVVCWLITHPFFVRYCGKRVLPGFRACARFELQTDWQAALKQFDT